MVRKLNDMITLKNLGTRDPDAGLNRDGKAAITSVLEATE